MLIGLQAVLLRIDVPRLPAKQQANMHRDLMEVSVTGLHALYAKYRYTVEQVTH